MANNRPNQKEILERMEKLCKRNLLSQRYEQTQNSTRQVDEDRQPTVGDLHVQRQPYADLEKIRGREIKTV